MRGLRLLSFVLSSGLALGACGSGDEVNIRADVQDSTPGLTDGDTAAGGTQLTTLPDGRWLLISANVGDQSFPAVIGASAPLEIDSVAGTATGDTGCNHFGGAVDVDGTSVSFSELAITEMACLDPDVMDQESRVLDILGRITLSELGPDGLKLLADNGDNLVYAAQAPVGTENGSLGELTWALESLVFGDAVSSTAADAELSFDTESGELTGFSGCNTIVGRFTATDEALAIESLDLGTEVCAEEIMEQERHMRDVLDGNPIFGIEGGDLLSIVEPGGLGLDLRPAAISADPGEDDQPGTFNPADLVGAPEQFAIQVATDAGVAVRVVERDGEAFAGTADYREDRVNLTIEEGTVTKADIG